MKFKELYDGMEDTKRKIFYLRESAKVSLLPRLQEACALQVELWRRVPYLALETKGRTGSGYYDSYGVNEGFLDSAYTYGLWALEEPRRNFFSDYCYVDCDSGRIVKRTNPYTLDFSQLSECSLSDLEYIMWNMNLIDAEKVVEKMIMIIDNPKYTLKFNGICYEEWQCDKWEEWQERMRKELGLQEVYKRLNS